MSTILIASLLPVILLLLYIYRRDTFNKEPLFLLLKAFSFGIFSAFVSIIVVKFLHAIIPEPVNNPFYNALYSAFVSAAIPEEFSKLLMLYLCIWHNRHFDEYYDGLEYAAFVGLGFAGLENILYILQYGLGLAIGRGLFSVPAHFFFAIFMGYFFAMARFRFNKRHWFLFLAFLIPVILHGLYNFLLIFYDNLNQFCSSPEVDSFSGAIYIGFLLFFFFVWRKAVKRINRMSGQ